VVRDQHGEIGAKAVGRFADRIVERIGARIRPLTVVRLVS
jgi:hypothetical protein